MLKNLVSLNFPPAPLKLARKNDQPMVWDAFRKKYLVLTPEEWVRQHLLHYLMEHLHYPQATLATESGFKLQAQPRRSDVLVYKNSRPMLLAECKAPQVKLTQNTLDQASRYNLHYQVPYIVLTNGLSHFAAKAKNKGYELLPAIPTYREL